MLRSIIANQLIFDFATEYYYTHQDAKMTPEFNVSDEEYAKFVAYLGDKDYDYGVGKHGYN